MQRFPDQGHETRAAQMRVALLTTPQGAFVSHHLIKHLRIVGVAVDVGAWVKPPALSRLERLERIYHRQGVTGVLVSLLAKATGGRRATGPADRARAAEARYLRDLDRVLGYQLYEDAVPLKQFPTWAEIHNYYNIPVVEVDDINSDHAVNSVAAWQPDLCIVVGGRVLKGPILSVAGSGVLNKHSSLLPRHRGLSAEYWCLYHEDFDALGVTVHYVAPGLDAGAIVLQQSLEFRKGDTPDTLRHRSELLGRDLLVEAVRLIEATGCTGTPQDESRASRNTRPTLLTDRTLYGKLPDLWKKYRALTMDFIITIDTEADDQWRAPAALTVENLQFVPRFQALCDRYHFKATYLCSYEVVSAPAFQLLRQFQERQTAEIGAHLHPWSNPPFRGTPSGGFDAQEYPSFPSELPLDVFSSKLELLTQAISERCGGAPRSYRAGRWGFNGEHVRVLADFGYIADCSVTPFVSWAHIEGTIGGGPDFTQADVRPYFLDEGDACQSGTSGVLEVPVTIVPSPLFRRMPGMFRRVRALRRSTVGRLAGRICDIEPHWFRPYNWMTGGGLVSVYEHAVRLELPVIEMMFHSSELMPGCSPYNQDAESIEALYRALEALFEKLSSDGCRGVTLSEFADGVISHRRAPDSI